MDRNALYVSILVPFDGSDGASRALRKALRLAKSYGSQVTVLSVDEHIAHYAPGFGKVEEIPALRKAYFAQIREQAMALAKEVGVNVTFETAVDNAAPAILRFAEERGFDLIVIGHAGHVGAWDKLLGSTTGRVVDQAHCDVMVVR